MGIGDEIIVTGQVRELQQSDPRKVRICYEKARPRWSEAWDNNPRIAEPLEVGDFQELKPRQDYLRPYCVKKTQEQWTWKAYAPPVGELYFSEWERTFGHGYGGAVIVEPNLKPGASPNKQWGLERWRALATILASRGVRLTQIGHSPVNLLPHARFVQTTIRQAAAMIAHARAVVVQEGALHHIAAALGTPAVVIFGSYISPQSTGYDYQTSLFVPRFSGDLGCGMRVTCAHCCEAMAAITPEMVCEKLIGLLNGLP